MKPEALRGVLHGGIPLDLGDALLDLPLRKQLLRGELVFHALQGGRCEDGGERLREGRGLCLEVSPRQHGAGRSSHRDLLADSCPDGLVGQVGEESKNGWLGADLHGLRVVLRRGGPIREQERLDLDGLELRESKGLRFH